MCVRRAGDDGRVNLVRCFAEFDGLVEESAEAEDLDEPGKGFGFVWVGEQALPQACHRIASATSVDFEHCEELVGDGEVGIESERALEGGCGEILVRSRSTAEFHI